MERRTQIALVAFGVFLSVAAPVIGSAMLQDGKSAGQNVEFDKANGPRVVLGESVDFTNENPWNESNTIILDPWGEFYSNGETSLRVTRFNGTWTNATNIDATNATLRIRPNDKPELAVDGGVTAVSYRGDITLDDDAVALEYSASNTGAITVNGLEADTGWDAVTPGGDTVDSGTTSSSGSATISVSSATAEDLILSSNHAPDAANIEPPDDKKLRDDDTAEFNVSVVDPEFGTAQGDTVTAELVYDGSVVHTESVSSNTTVSATHQIVDGGAHTWYWRLTDSYGAVTETEERIVEAPAVLEIRDEQNASQLVSTETEVTVTFFGRDGEIVTKTTTNGTVDLTGLPINRRFTVRADAENYTSRRTILESLYRQQSVYLLDENESTVTVEYQLEDDTGLFSATETELLIQRALDPNGDGNSSFVTVSADQFGATGSYSASLVKDARYRLVVRNDDGDRRSLGTYIPRESRIQPLPIGRVEFSTDVENGVRFDASVETTKGDRILRVYYQDIDNQTESVTFNATYRNGTSIAQQTFTGPLGSTVATFDLPDNSTSNGIRVRYNADKTTGSSDSGRVLIGGVSGFGDQFGVGERLRILTGVAAILAVTGLTVIAYPSAAALIAVGTASILHLIGWMTTSPLALGLAGFVALAYTFGDRS